MKRCLLFLCLVMTSTVLADPPRAFPGAEGFGALATGGAGGEVAIVTTLDDSGPGSFREAVSKPHRIVVFAVGGLIELKSNVAVSNDMTIAGQTAPGDGICLYARNCSVSDRHNVIIRYMRFREGVQGDRGKCSLTLANSHNVIVDHCSIEWGRWDCLGVTQGSSEITFQYCIIGEGVAPQRFGSLVDSVENVTFSHNLWINNHSRNPKAKGTIEYVNNVIYNYGITGLAGGHSGGTHYLDAINNCIIRGPDSNESAAGGFADTDHVYSAGNVVDRRRELPFTPTPMTEKDFGDGDKAPTFETQPHFNSPLSVKAQSAEAAYAAVVTGAGDSLHRDGIDQRLIDAVKSNGTKGKIIEDEKESGGIALANLKPAKLDVDPDGIPASWKQSHASQGAATLQAYLSDTAKDGN